MPTGIAATGRSLGFMISSFLLALSLLLSAALFWFTDARLGFESLAVGLFLVFWRLSDRLAGVENPDEEAFCALYYGQKFVVSFGVALLCFFIADNWGTGW